MIVIGIFFGLGISIAVLDILCKKYKEESKQKDEYLHLTREYVRTIKENVNESRKIYHDLQAHIGSLWYYMEKEDYQKAKNYLYSMRRHMDKTIYRMVSVNHEIVDAVLLGQQIQAEALNIQWQIEGMLPDNLVIDDFDLCTIFSNLLANSVESCEKLPPNQRIIHLEIRRLENHLLIELENPSIKPIKLKDLGRVTSKLDASNHGYGISNVKAAVQKNHGEIDFKYQENMFMVQILFQLEN